MKKKEPEVVRISVTVHPRSSAEELREVKEGVVHIRLQAAPTDGKANEALVRFIAKLLGTNKSSIDIVQGEKSRHKILAIRGIPQAEIFEKIDKALARGG